MRNHFLPGSFPLLAVLFALVSCGEMDTIISASSSYAVDALVGDRYLEEAAVVDASALIRPVFSSDVADDPDAVGLRVVLTDENGDPVAQPVEYRERGSALRSESADGEGLVSIDSLSGELPGFALPAELAVGRYTLRFEVLGASGVLYEESRSVYYTADQALELTSLASFPPGAEPAAEVPLFPTATNLLFEAKVDAGPDFDPYLIWSSGGKRLAAARVSDGGARLLWKTPDTAGFFKVEVSLYPTEPRGGEASSLIGDSRFLTIATSPDASAPGLPKADGEYALIYRLLGDLTAAGTSSSKDSSLEPMNDGEAVWLPFATGYGLAVGPLRSFAAIEPAFPSLEGGLIPARVSIRAALLSEGLVWKASFPGIGGGSFVELALEAASAGPRLLLRSGGEEHAVEAELDPAFSPESRLLEIELKPAQSDDGLWSLSLLIDGTTAGAVSFDPSALSGVGGGFSIGGGGTETSADSITAIIDDIASSALPALPVPDETAPEEKTEGAEAPDSEASR